jgi:protein TonB
MTLSVNRDRNPEFILLSFVLHAVFAFFLIRHHAEEPKSVAVPLGITFEIEQKEEPAKPIQKPVQKIEPQKKNVQKEIARAVESKNIVQPPTATQKIEAVNVQTRESSQTKAEVTDNEPKPVKEIPASFTADYLKNPHPSYPSISRRLGEEGKVLLRVQVSADGFAGAVTVQKSSGFERLDESALNSVKNWRFVPAKKGDQNIVSWVLVPIVFSLNR